MSSSVPSMQPFLRSLPQVLRIPVDNLSNTPVHPYHVRTVYNPFSTLVRLLGTIWLCLLGEVFMYPSRSLTIVFRSGKMWGKPCTCMHTSLAFNWPTSACHIFSSCIFPKKSDNTSNSHENTQVPSPAFCLKGWKISDIVCYKFLDRIDFSVPCWRLHDWFLQPCLRTRQTRREIVSLAASNARWITKSGRSSENQNKKIASDLPVVNFETNNSNNNLEIEEFQQTKAIIVCPISMISPQVFL